MEVIRRKNGLRYRESIYINGKKVRSPTFLRKTDARSWKANKMLERERFNATGIIINNEISVKELSEIWMNSNIGKATTTVKAYSGIIKNYVLPFFGHMVLKNVQVHHAQTFKNKVISKGLSTETINNILKVAKILFKFATDNEYLILSPFRKISDVKSNRNLSSNDYWGQGEVLKFLRANQGCHYIELFEFVLLTGLRKAEVCGLCWDCVDLNSKRIMIKRSRDREGLKNTTKNNLQRSILLSERAVEILKGIRERTRNLEFVFCREDFERPVTYEHLTDRFFYPAIKKAGVRKIKFHGLRTTFASNFAMSGGSLSALQKFLGHASIEVTMKHYAHLADGYLSDQVKFIGYEDGPRLRQVQ